MFCNWEQKKEFGDCTGPEVERKRIKAKEGMGQNERRKGYKGPVAFKQATG